MAANNYPGSPIVHLRVPGVILDRVRADASRNGMSLAEWFRHAARQRLEHAA